MSGSPANSAASVLLPPLLALGSHSTRTSSTAECAYHKERQSFGDYPRPSSISADSHFMALGSKLALSSLLRMLPHVSAGWRGGNHAFLNVRHPAHAQQGWQARATGLLRPSYTLPAGVHLRRRLDRWNVPTLCCYRVERWLSRLHEIAGLVAPRIIAAANRTACNGWATARRFQGHSRCILGCVAEDSLEHYACCAGYHKC